MNLNHDQAATLLLAHNNLTSGDLERCLAELAGPGNIRGFYLTASRAFRAPS